MKMTKRFIWWFCRYAVRPDYWQRWYRLSEYHRWQIQLMTYRAYRRGIKDGRQYERTKTYTF